MMYLTGMVDKRTLEKYEREAKEKNRETWYLSWCMDTNQEGETQLHKHICIPCRLQSSLHFQNETRVRLSKSAEATSRRKPNTLPSWTRPVSPNLLPENWIVDLMYCVFVCRSQKLRAKHD